ncbi:hypothetical protein L9F63_008087, partial [Diploptera punctata]
MLLVFAMWLLPTISAMTESDWGSVEDPAVRSGESNCDCLNTTEHHDDLFVDCRCTGEQLTEIPRNLLPGLQML